MQVRLGDLFDPIVGNAYLAGGLNDASTVLQGVRLIEGQNRNPELGFVMWMGYQLGEKAGSRYPRVAWPCLCFIVAVDWIRFSVSVWTYAH